MSSSDEYDPERVNFDKELLRRFYLRNGYVDFAVTDATAELAPDRTSFFVTFTLHEGARYRVGKVSVEFDAAPRRGQVAAEAMSTSRRATGTTATRWSATCSR